MSGFANQNDDQYWEVESQASALNTIGSNRRRDNTDWPDDQSEITTFSQAYIGSNNRNRDGNRDGDGDIDGDTEVKYFL